MNAVKAEASWGRLVSLDEALLENAQKLRLTAPVGAGKTEFIVRKAAQLVASEVSASKILCVASSPTAAHQLRNRLRRAGELLGSCIVLTPLQVSASVLKKPEAQAFTGRGARLLGGAEFNMLLEDMKTDTSDMAVLRSLLSKASKGFASLTAVDGWGVDEAELALYDSMLRRLRFQGAILREEAPFLTASYLRATPGAQGFYHAVFVDDAQNVSAATMEACRLLASDVFVACGNPNQAQAGFDGCFTLQAFRELGDTATCVRLAGASQPTAIASFCDALCRKGAMDASVLAGVPDGEHSDKALACIKWREPEDEFLGVASMIRALSRERSDVDPGDFFVLVPNRAWANAVARCLKRRKIDSVITMDADPVAGDPRSEDSGVLSAYCRLALAADVGDASAWRLWCGLGRRNCGVKVWSAFMEWADDLSLGAADALAMLSASASEGEPFEGASELRARYQAGLDAIDGLAGRRGFPLLKALGATVGGKQISSIIEPIQGDEDVRELYRCLVERSLEPSFVPDRCRVSIGSYKLIQGLSPRYVIACGLVEGYVPSIPHAKLMEGSPAAIGRLDADRRSFYNAVGKAQEMLVLSTVQRAEIGLAEKLRMDARRVKYEHGRKVAVLARTVFVDEAGDAAPNSVSGEQFLAEAE